ncbi:MAG: DnaD domain protein [Ruminococcaceae bacterium]|nr:DnaD domain protein [Oscillospiraceae bacterium]
MPFKLKPFRPADTLYIPSEICRFLPAANPADVKFILYLYDHAAKDPSFEVFDEDTVRSLGMLSEAFTDEELHHAVMFWRAVGVLAESDISVPSYNIPVRNTEPVTAPSKNTVFDKEKKPSYTSSQLADAAEIPAFSALLEYTEKRLNKMLNPSELAVLFSFYDYLALPPEVIMLATEHCLSEGKRSLRYIEKLLLDFVDKDIITYEAAEAYVNQRKRYKSLEGQVRSLCGMGDRSLTKTEKTIIGEWSSDSSFNFDLLREAYDITIRTINKPTISYINKILIRWANEGIDTVEKLHRQSTSGNSGNGSPAGGTLPTYDLDDFFKAAVEKERK